MNGPLLYNPGRAGRDELEAMLAARPAFVARLIAELRADAGQATRRHWQLIGPCGSGKSHLTQVLALRLEADHGWAVARLPEEHYQIGSVGDLLEQIVMRLEQVDRSPLAEVASADLEARALERIRRFHAATGRPILVVIEHLAILCARQLRDRRGQQRLRQLLSERPPFVVVATSTSDVGATGPQAAPLADLFQVVTLDDLTGDQVATLLEARVRWDRDPSLLERLARVRGRGRAMYHFSGGNPRLVLALYAIVRAGWTDDLHTCLLRLLDQVTPSYQARLGEISPQMGRVLTALALDGDPQCAADLARRVRMPTNQVTAHLAKLEAARLIRPVARGEDKRRRYYDLTDRLFRLWIQLREDGSARQRLRLLADFYQRWYEGAPAADPAPAARRDAAPYAQAVARLLKTEALRASDQLPPYSTAVEVRAAPHRAALLAPELREAVELLLAPPPSARS